MKLRGHIFTALRQITILCLLSLIPQITNAKVLYFQQGNNGKWGVLEYLSGQFVIQPQFDALGMYPFDFDAAGFYCAKLNGKWGFINKSGQFVIQPQFDQAYGFATDGLAAVQSNGKWGFIDISGQFVIQPQFDVCFAFGGGLAAVELNGKWGVINKSGQFVIQPQFNKTNGFRNGLAAVELNGKWGFIDISGQFVIQPQFDDCYSFFNGLTTAAELNGKWGFIDKSGTFVIQPQFDQTSDCFYEGLATVKLNGKWGFIDISGQFVIQPQFDDCFAFSNGLADVKLNGKWGCIDKTGKYVIQPKFDQNLLFDDGLAVVALNGTSYYVDRYGNFYTDLTDALSAVKNIEYEVKSGESYPAYMSRMVPSWEQYLLKKHIIKPEVPSDESIKRAIDREIGIWQQKDEFESTPEWQQRVNETTRNAKIQEIEARIQLGYNAEIESFNKRLSDNKDEYEELYRDASAWYCQVRAKEFAKQTFELKPYDADNATYLISSESDGDILLPVPRAKAREFKTNWDSIKANVTAVFVPTGNDVALKSVTFGDYTYDGNTKANYAVTAVEYNFAPIEIANLDLASVDYNLDPLNLAPTVTISNPDVKTISTTRVKPETRTVSTGSASDVDLNIPQSKATAKNTFAIVIANETYKNVESVENAANDGKIVAQYLTTTLGIPQKQVFAYTNASYGEMVDALDKMQNIAKAYSGTNYNVIFYYAGHGVPDEQSHEAYLLPIDGKPGSSAVNISLSKLYSTLGNLGASTVYVMLDACFSGSQRGDGMLAQARGVAIKAKAAEPQGNMIVLSAAQGDETAYPYQGKSHGLFTYYLLKKLQESSGNVTIGELSDYVIENVRKTSVLENNGKLQTPTVRASLSSGDAWRNNKLVK